MKKNWLLTLFGLMLVAQWLVPSKLIYDSEKTISDGVSFMFRTRPVDPYDPFRGKYITLYFEDNKIERDTLESFRNGESVFVLVEADTLGMGIPTTISHSVFPTSNYFEATVSYSDWRKEEGYQRVFLEFPFNKFFLEETLAPQAEMTYSETRSDTIPGFAVVKIKDGSAVLQDVMINDSSIVDLVKARMAKK